MNYRLANDPNEERARLEARIRGGLVRSAIIWTPLFVVTGGAFVYYLLGQLFGFGGGTWFLVVVLGFLSFLMGFQSINTLRDLAGGTREIEGEVTRRWARRDSLVFQSHYIRLDKKIFRIDGLYHRDINVGDRVRLRYFPASMVVLTAERLDVPETRKPPITIDAEEPGER